MFQSAAYLRDLSIDRCSIGDYEWTELAKLPALEVLRLSGPQISDETVPNIEHGCCSLPA